MNMAKLSSNCRPPLQGMMLLALLFLALMAFVDAQGAVFEGFKGFVDLGHKVQGAVVGFEGLKDLGPHKTQGSVVEEVEKLMGKKAQNTALNILCKRQGWKTFCNGVKTGIKVHKYSCKAQGLMDRLNPGGASGTPSFDRFLFIDLSTSFPPSFMLPGIGNSVVICLRSAERQVPAAAGTGAATTLFTAAATPP